MANYAESIEMSKYAEGIDWDTTFCSNKECKNTECMRHLKSENAKSYPPYRPMYVADFKDKCERRTKENE